MDRGRAFFRDTELCATTLPSWRDGILGYAAEAVPQEPRRYPGVPRVALPRLRPRRLCALDQALVSRRSARELGTALPQREAIARVLLFGHAVHGAEARGPVPSAGGLQALELYLVRTDGDGVAPGDWLTPGVYHYDRVGHFLSRLRDDAPRGAWLGRLPSMELIRGGALFFLLVGDGPRVAAKYGERGLRFLLLEAGHLMQNLCVLASSVGLGIVPLGGFMERDTAAALRLPKSDEVLYAAACG